MIFAINCYRYGKHRSKQKNWHTNNIKLENHFDNINKIEDFESESVLICNVSCKNLTGAKLLAIRFNKIDGFIRFYDGTK